MTITFAPIREGDPLPPEAAKLARGDRRRLAIALRHLCPELTEDEALALSLKPPPGSPADITVAGCKDLILRELPALRATAPYPPGPSAADDAMSPPPPPLPLDKWDDTTHWDDPIDPWPDE